MILGIEGGGTRTVALWDGGRIEAGPLNLKLASDKQVLTILRETRGAVGRAVPSAPRLRNRHKPNGGLGQPALPRIGAIGVCLAGCRTAADRSRLRGLIRRVFGKIPMFVGSDLDSGLAAAFGVAGDGILVISGTGSVIVGRKARTVARVGGWGHLLGDQGSGYWLALRSLQRAVREFDRTGKPIQILRRLNLNSVDELVDWMQHATKGEVAALVTNDRQVFAEGVEELAADCVVVARKLKMTAPRVVLAGGVFAHQPVFARLTARAIRQALPRAKVARQTNESALGALRLASSGSAKQALDR